MNNKLIYSLSLIVIASSLSACSKGIANDARHAETYEQRHPITLKKEVSSIEVPIEINGNLSVEDDAKLKSFLYRFHENSETNLVITVPESGIKVGLARNAVKDVIKTAEKIGIKKQSIRVGTYKPLSSTVGGIRMRFEAVIAEAPDCSNMWSENLADAYNNDISKGHGCATRNNLAMMIANPTDLVTKRALGAGVSARRVDVLDKYVAGQTTSASRDSSETASATTD